MRTKFISLMRASVATVFLFMTIVTAMPAPAFATGNGPDKTPDACSNLPGDQEAIPEGMILDEHDHCVEASPITNAVQQDTDACPNIDGNQKDLPSGMVFDNGDCVCPSGIGIHLQGSMSCKVYICHRGLAIDNPYQENDVAIESVDGGPDNGDHYSEHNDQLFNTSMQQGDKWGDIIPPIPGKHSGLNWSAEGQAIWNNNCNVPDACPNISGTQILVPDNKVLDNEGNCFTDACPNISGIQTQVPSDKVVDEQGDCVTDVCPNLNGIQTQVPEDKVLDNEGNCVTDVCPNLDGIQTELPMGKVFDEESGYCVEPPTDLCENIQGVQTDTEECVTDVCPNIEGIQTEVPKDMVVDRNGDCITPGRGGDVIELLTPVKPADPGTPVKTAELVNTGTSSLLNISAGLAIIGLTAGLTQAYRRRSVS